MDDYTDGALWRTAYYSVVLGITIRTYFPGDFAKDRAIHAAKRDADDYGYEGSAPVRVEYYDGKTWREHGRYEAPAIVADALAYEGS